MQQTAPRTMLPSESPELAEAREVRDRHKTLIDVLSDQNQSAVKWLGVSAALSLSCGLLALSGNLAAKQKLGLIALGVGLGAYGFSEMIQVGKREDQIALAMPIFQHAQGALDQVDAAVIEFRKQSLAQDLQGILEGEEFEPAPQIQLPAAAPQIQTSQQYQQQHEPHEPQQSQPLRFDPIAQEASMGRSANQSEPQAASMFPVEDIAKAIAKTTANPNAASSLFILAPRGCGKTGLMQQAQFETWQAWQGRADFHIFAGKDDEKYCGLEEDEQRYIYSGDPDHALNSITRIERLVKERTAKLLEYPTIVIKDENNNTIRAARSFDRVDSITPKRNLFARMTEADYAIITKGRSKLCVCWMTSHTPRKSDTGQETGVFANVYSAVLGRTADGSPMYGMIKECLTGSDSNRVIDDVERRAALLAQFMEYRKRLDEGVEDGSRVLCLTNIGGRWRLALLPVYQKDIHTIKYDDPYEEFDEQMEEKHGVDPDTVIAPSSVEVLPPEPDEDIWAQSGLNQEMVNAVKTIQQS
jgi:hypothetical protein